MPDMRDLLKKRVEFSTAKMDSFAAKHAKSMADFNKGLAPRINALRVLGPAEPQMTELHRSFIKGRTDADMIIGRCLFCDPEPQVFTCPACDHQTAKRYEMTIHNMLDPEWCRERAAKKAREWSRHA